MLALLVLVMLLQIVTSSTSVVVEVLCKDGLDVNPLNAAALQVTNSWFNQYYPNSLTKCNLFRTSNGSKDLAITINFSQLNTERNFDLVQVYMVKSFSSTTRTVQAYFPAIMTLSGDLMNTHVSAKPGEALLVVLKTDDNINSFYGYRATATARMRDCFVGMKIVQVFSNSSTATDINSNVRGMCWILISSETVELQLISNSDANNAVQVLGVSDFDSMAETFDVLPQGTNLMLTASTAKPVYSRFGETLLLRSDGKFVAKAKTYVDPNSTLAPTVGVPLRCPSAAQISSVALTSTPQPLARQNSKQWCIILVPPSNAHVASILVTTLALVGRAEMNIYLLDANYTQTRGNVKDFDSSIGSTLGTLTRFLPLPLTYTGPRALLVQYSSETDTSASFTATVRTQALFTPKPTFDSSSPPFAVSSRPTIALTTTAPSSNRPTTLNPTRAPLSSKPTTLNPTRAPSSSKPTTKRPVTSNTPTSVKPTTQRPTFTKAPTKRVTQRPTRRPSTLRPTTKSPSAYPTTREPTFPRPTMTPTTMTPFTRFPTAEQTFIQDTFTPTILPTHSPSRPPSLPTLYPIQRPSTNPTLPTSKPTYRPSSGPLPPTSQPR